MGGGAWLPKNNRQHCDQQSPFEFLLASLQLCASFVIYLYLDKIDHVTNVLHVVFHNLHVLRMHYLWAEIL